MVKEFDIVLFGATSFVGKIVARYLTQLDSASNLKWAIAGRSARKLDELRQELGEAASDLPTIIADATDNDALKRMCDSTRVVISTVGPYALYGEPLVKACASLGTDYCDLTGEPQWIAKMLTRYESIAKISGARIVHSCGFDSIPSDLGVHFLQQEAKQQFGHPCPIVKLRVKAIKGAASGGTIASMLNLIKEASANPDIRRVLVDPYALCPPGHNFGARQINHKSAHFDEDLDAWIAPFVMAAINTRIVHRSNALLDGAYGDRFLYDEALVTGKESKGGIKATLTSMGLGGFMFAAAIPPSRWFLEKLILPKPGEGPSLKAQERGFFDIRLIGKTLDGRKVCAKVTGDRDPGYGSTAKMLAQSAICLAQDMDGKDGGFWTPATLMGDTLIDRLTSHAGLTFEMISADAPLS